MKTVIGYFSKLANELNVKSWARKALFIIGLILLIATLVNIGSILHETKRTKGQVSARDNDAGRGIQTATLTRWWNSNHFAPYGNVYFRFAHTIAKLAPSDVSENVLLIEQEELVHHFALLLTSLFSLTLLCLTCAYLLLRSWVGSIWVANIFIYLGIQDPTWVEFLFRVHPDHTLMFFCFVASYFTLRYSKTADRHDFILAGLLWGIATAVKRSTILFIPSFIYLFLSEGLNKNSVMKGMRFIGFMLLSYLIIGFPQNFGFYKQIRFLYLETFNSRPPSVNSVIEYLELIFSQSKYFWFAFIPLHLFFGKQERLMNLRFFIFSMIAMVFVLSGSMNTSHNHHIMPHVTLLLVLVLFTIKLLPVLPFRWKNVVLAGVCVLVLLFIPSRFAEIENEKRNQLACSTEIKAAIKVVNEIQRKENAFLLMDPYFPFAAEMSGLTKQIWGVSGEDLDNKKAALWGTQRGFVNGQTKRPHRHQHYELTSEEWTAKLNFYTQALTQQTVVTPKGAVFEKIYEDSCNYMIWKRKN